ncbi:MAG: riboflavin biosynthesis protein RibF [Neisseriaceae bacterium]|jgi:riboflavin kinase/FMN adenylyltransferase
MFRFLISPKEKIEKVRNSVVTVGSFDGMHKGHMQLLYQMNKLADDKGLKRILITFEPLPPEYFADLNYNERLARLSLLRDKLLILENSKNAYIDELVILRFNIETASLSANQFIEDVLINQLNAEDLVIGHDFKFGKNGSGNIDNLRQYGLNISVVPPFYIDEQRVSSSLIRNYAKLNELQLVKKYLGHNLHYTSRVIYGNQLGRKFGVPTINLCLGKNRPALWGIYVAYVYIDGIRYNAVASIGKNPTVSDLEVYKLEAHLLDVDLNLYGKVARVEILEFLREEHKFDDLDSLFKQIYVDLDNTRLYFTKVECNGL